MIVYEVYYADVLIGHLRVNNGLHQYVPDTDAVRAVQQKAVLLRETAEHYSWGKPIRFFDQMIRNNKHIGREKVIYAHNNNYGMRVVSENDFV